MTFTNLLLKQNNFGANSSNTGNVLKNSNTQNSSQNKQRVDLFNGIHNTPVVDNKISNRPINGTVLVNRYLQTPE
jgi:hypothetical protein